MVWEVEGHAARVPVRSGFVGGDELLLNVCASAWRQKPGVGFPRGMDNGSRREPSHALLAEKQRRRFIVGGAEACRFEVGGGLFFTL